MNRAQEAIVSDLARIVDQARWASTHGYWKAGRGLDREPGASLRESAEDADAHAAMFDLEIGDHKAREAYEHAVRAVARADVLLASLVDGLQPPLLRLSVFAGPRDLAKVAKAAAWRTEHATVLNAKRFDAVRKVLDRAVRGLSKAMDDGPADGIAHGEQMCRTCSTRPRAERVKADGTARVSKAGECDVCAQWRYRNGGTRPVSLDRDELRVPREAQQRRLARDEGWGAA